jgi:hypothetical protein
MREIGRIIAGGSCGENDCPTIALVEGEPGMIDVQGYHQSDIPTPSGEVVARIPVSVLLEAARVLGN